MALADDLKAFVKATHADSWTTRDGQRVPEAEDLGLGNEAVLLDGVVLYADLADSTGLVKGWKDCFAAEVYKNFLYCAAKVIRLRGGTITAFDGDRIMAVFIGSAKNSEAAKCALQIKGVAKDIVAPAIKARYPKSTFALKHKVGVDSSKLFVAKTGIRGSNDLVWVGNAANNAAKMAALPTTYASYISAATYNMLNKASRFANGDSTKNMWTDLGSTQLGYKIYGSNYSWAI